MGSRKKNTILWLVSWAVLFLIVAYSPIGRPDLYVGNSYQVYNQSVSFKGGIANAPTGNYTQGDNSDIEAPTYTPVNSSNGEYEGNASRYRPQSSAVSSYNSGSNQNPGNGNNANGVVLAYNSRKSAAQGTSTAQNNDVSSLSSDLTLTSNVENRQAASPNQPTGGRDPGGKNPKNPIPVGDGIWILLTLASVYTSWKMKISIFTKRNKHEI